MDHIEIYVSNLEKSKAFYSWLLEKLGFKLFQEWAEGFSYKKEAFYIVFVQVRDVFLNSGYHRCHIGLNHLAFSCKTKREIDDFRLALISKGITLLYDEQFPHAGGDATYAVYFEDPDRIKVEIVCKP